MDYSLKKIIEKNAKKVDNFACEYPDFMKIIDKNILVGKDYTSAISQANIYDTPFELSQIIQTQHKYYENSVIFMLQGNLNESYTLLRLAMELSRDILVLSKKPDLMELWKNREEEYGKYRKKFKFNHEHPANMCAHELYKLASSYGVHGHQTTLLNCKELKNEDNFDFTELSLTTERIVSNLETWFSAFFPIYGNLIDCLSMSNPVTQDTISAEKEVMELCKTNIELLQGS
ncbi:MAG: hypothetical protein RPR97_12060 [Colwellia sp.]